MSAISGRVFIFQKDNYWLISPKRLERSIRSTRSVVDVSVKKQFPNQISVAVTEKEARFRYESAGETYLIDEQGRVAGLSQISGSNTNEPLITITFENGLPFDPNEKAFSDATASFLENNLAIVHSNGIVLASITLTAESERTVRFTTKDGWQIILDPTQSTTLAMESALRVYRELSINEQKILEYIDGRIPGRVIYR